MRSAVAVVSGVTDTLSRAGPYPVSGETVRLWNSSVVNTSVAVNVQFWRSHPMLPKLLPVMSNVKSMKTPAAETRIGLIVGKLSGLPAISNVTR